MGVSYCATCDANFFKDLDIYVVGGDNSAAGGALYLSKFGKHVYIIHRGEELTASETMKDRVESDEKISCIGNSVVTELGGMMDLSEITVKDVHTGDLTTYKADEQDGMIGVFFMGTHPNTDLFAGTDTQSR